MSYAMIGCKQFLLLVWKGLLLRKRHFIVSGFELGLPLVLICASVYMRTAIFPPSYINDYQRPARPSRVPDDSWIPAQFYEARNVSSNSFCRWSSCKLYYAPDNNLTLQLVQKIERTLLDQSKSTIQGIPAKNNEDLEILLYNDSLYYGSQDAFGVVFTSLDDNDKTLPKHLDYTLRVRGFFETTMKYKRPSPSGASYDASYEYTEFNTLQHIICKSLIEQRMEERNFSNSKVFPQIWLQRFPFPEFKRQYSDSLPSGGITFFIIIPYIIIYAFLLPSLVFVKRIADEKANRAKEMLKMMGLSDLVYWSGTFTNNFVVMAIICAITTILYKIPFLKDSAVVDRTDGFLFFVVLILYISSMLLMCMAVITFLNKAAAAVIITLLLWVVSHVVPLVLVDPPGSTNYYTLTVGTKLALCLLPNMAFQWACKIMDFHEGAGVGALWSNISTPGNVDDNLTLSMVLGMLLLNCVIYSIIIWYIDNVWPFQYGVPLPVYYPFMPSYWRRLCGKGNIYILDEEIDMASKSKYFEDQAPSVETGIVLKHLTKELGWGSSRKLAVNDVSMKIYHGGITALLGHNGAGKTTTMNMITGLFPPTRGTAIINGYDIRSETKLARRGLGLCPQHNVLYDTLTVEEHLILFCGLKGVPFNKIKEEVAKTIEFLQLIPQKQELSRNLSGGMKRKLSLGIAMIGGSQVLILDEPTTGMDPSARRTVWDMLNVLKRDKTILLTTHFMDEADVLGDRIAIMADGYVQCYGSSLYLKKIFGAGYHLRLLKNEGFSLSNVISVVKKHVPEVIVDSDLNTEVTLLLNTKSTQTLVGLFEEIESKKRQLGIEGCGLSITTMEDVFLKVGQLAEQGLADFHATDEKENTAFFEDAKQDDSLLTTTAKKLEGSRLQLQILKGLILKRFHDAKRYPGFYIFQLILPLLIVFLMVYVDQLIMGIYKQDTVPLTLSISDVFKQTIALYTPGNMSADIMTQYKNFLEFSSITPDNTNSISEHILDIGRTNLQSYRMEHLVGGSAESDNPLNLTAWYNGEAYHTSPMSLNIIHNAVFNYMTGSSDSKITVTNYPLKWNQRTHLDNSAMVPASRMIYSICLCIALTFLSSSYVLFPIHERVTKSKLIQMMTGLYRPMFWIAHFLWDFTVYAIFSVILLIPFAAIDFYSIFSGGSNVFGALYFLLLMYGWSSIPLTYLVSFFPKKPSGGFLFLTILNIVAGLISSLVITGLMQLENFKRDVGIAIWFLRFIPIFSITWGVGNLRKNAFDNSLCNRMTSREKELLCPTMKPDIEIFQCCTNYCEDACFQSKAYLRWDKDASGCEVFFMFLDGLIFFGLLLLLETNFVKLWYNFKQRRANAASQVAATQEINIAKIISEDSDVAAERYRVEELVNRGEIGSEALVVMNLSKNFGNTKAVDQLTFSIHHKECFGLLGVNGAGKTTTFSMLTGDLMIDKGNAYIHSYNIKNDLHSFQTYIGYCPQFDALLDRLSGREYLSFFARLRGIPEEDIELEVSKLIRMTDLDAHADKISAKYSGGNRRKLSLALALIGTPPVVFLDEPTSGVDPGARRKIWETLISAQRSGVMSFVLTTHSMEECEALCSRLAIMVNGTFRCLGSNQHLKSRFGEGYTVIVKLQQAHSFDTEAIDAVRQFIEQKFPLCALKDLHQGTLTYHILDRTLSWSVLFNTMETAKERFSLEDYVVHDTTLEQIFIGFARSQYVQEAT